MIITAKDLLIHKAQREAIEKRVYELAEARDYQKPRGHYKPQYFIEELEIEEGYIDVRFFDSRAQDSLNMRFTFDEICLDNLQAIVEAC